MQFLVAMADSNDFFTWNEVTLGVCDRQMDKEHQNLIALMNKLHLHQVNNSPRVELSKSFKELLEYSRLHFNDEEAHMEKMGFPDIDHHKQLHAVLLEKLIQHLKDFEDGPGKIKPAFFEFLKAWLITHIRGADQKYSKFQDGLG